MIAVGAEDTKRMAICRILKTHEQYRSQSHGNASADTGRGGIFLIRTETSNRLSARSLRCLALVGCLVLAISLGQLLLGSASGTPIAAAEASEREQVQTYLELALLELETIDAILADSELDLLEKESGGDEELTELQIEHYRQLLTGYRASLSQVLSGLDSRQVPGLADLHLHRGAQQALFQATDDLLAEYEQILGYTAALLQMSISLENMAYYDENDLDATYQTISGAIQEALDSLSAADVPTFLTYVNINLADSLTQLDEAVLYTLQAAYIDDPVRIHAAAYRMDILMRHFDSLVAGIDQDIVGRQSKLIAEAEQIAQTADGLKAWLGQNISLLNAD